VPNRKNYWSIWMIEPAQIVAQKYYGCGTPQSVYNFCNRYNVNRFWWRPPSGQKRILMIDWQNFRESYKEVYGSFRSATNWSSPRSRSTSKRRTYATSKTRSRFSTTRQKNFSRKTRTYRTRRAA